MPPAPYTWHFANIPLPPEEVVRRLQAWTEPRLGGMTFRGRVEAGSLRIARRIDYQNSFLPHLSGSVETFSGGSRLRFRLGLHPLVALLMFGVVASGFWMARFVTELSPWLPALVAGLFLGGMAVSYLWEVPKLLRQVAICLDVEPEVLGLRGRSE